MNFWDHRQQINRPFPPCDKHGLQWSNTSQRCETPIVAQTLDGLGFLQNNSGPIDDYFFDEFGNYWEYSWFDFNGGGGGGAYDYPSWPDLPAGTINYPVLLPEPGIAAGNPFELIADWLSNFVSGNYDQQQASAPLPMPANGNFQLPPFADYGAITPAGTTWPGNDATSLQIDLPGVCPPGTGRGARGASDYECTPFTADPAGRKRAAQQQRAQQQAAQQKRAQQQQQNKACPPDKQGRKVWKNPQTGKCELVPTCDKGLTFDQVTGRCLAQSQLKTIYGGLFDNWWVWLLVALGAGIIYNQANKSPQSQPSRRNKKK